MIEFNGFQRTQNQSLFIVSLKLSVAVVRDVIESFYWKPQSAVKITIFFDWIISLGWKFLTLSQSDTMEI